MFGCSGHDDVDGQVGLDVLVGGKDFDRLNGLVGNDRLYGGFGIRSAQRWYVHRG